MQQKIRQVFVGILALVFLSACRQLDSIPALPETTPQAFLQNQHYIPVQVAGYSFIWSQPGSTLIVYLVGLFTVYAGYTLLRNTGQQRAVTWWGTGLLLTGIGALFAGTSYQGFGYEIKCSGREICTYTSWWEVMYVLLSVPGMNAFLAATAYTTATGRFRKAIMAYAVINTMAYWLLVLYGAFAAVKFLVSFECMVLVAVPALIFLLLLHGINYVKKKDQLNRVLLTSWLIFMAVAIAYGAYLGAGISNWLWQKGVWFTENDVLHVGMIGWVYYVYTRLPRLLVDLK